MGYPKTVNRSLVDVSQSDLTLRKSEEPDSMPPAAIHFYSSLKGVGAEVQAAKEEASIMPIEDKSGPSIQPVKPAPSEPRIGLGPDLLRRMLFDKMKQEFLALVQAIEEGDPPATGYNLGLIVILHAILVVGHREMLAMERADQQEALNEVLGSFTQMLQLMRRIQANAGENGVRDPAEAARITAELQRTMTDIFGPMKSEANPNGWSIENNQIIPGTGSQLDKFMTAMWLGRTGSDPMENPVYRMLNGFVGVMNGKPPTADDSSYKLPPGMNFMQAMTGGFPLDASAWVNMMGFNYHQDAVSGPDRGGTDYVGQGNQEWGAIQASSTGMSGQISMLIQQLLSEITQLIDTARSIHENDSRVNEKIIRNVT
jgi:hypothetical protein